MEVRTPAGALTFYDLGFAPWFLPQPIKFLRQRKILPRQPAFVVRGEDERHADEPGGGGQAPFARLHLAVMPSPFRWRRARQNAPFRPGFRGCQIGFQNAEGPHLYLVWPLLARFNLAFVR